MSEQPFYHLRPNKCIDRSLFVQMLAGLSRVLPIARYQYTGFGSFLFDDFRAFHDILNIGNMISLERDERECDRARYNVPYNCISVRNISFSDYLSELDIGEDEHNIFWLDFTDPRSLGRQISDYASLLEMLNPNDVVRITLNAAPSTLGDAQKPEELQRRRLEVLKDRVNDEYLPPQLSPEAVTTTNYPRTLLEIIKNATTLSLTDEPPYSPNFLFPLFSNIYADGQQMLTFTGIVLNSHENEALIRTALENYAFVNFSWNTPNFIEIPALSIREITELNKLLPNPDVRQLIIAAFPFIFSEHDPQPIESYISYYKYYPNYFKVSF